jgi:hypothetical protein
VAHLAGTQRQPGLCDYDDHWHADKHRFAMSSIDTRMPRAGRGGGPNRTAPLLKQGQLAWISCGYRDAAYILPGTLHPGNHGDAGPIND